MTRSFTHALASAARRQLLALGIGIVVLGGAAEAYAIPAFARRHEVACNTCHQQRYPQLNAYGRRFRENGYQLPDGAEDAARARRSVEPGTTEERLSIFKELPLSLRAQVFGTAPVDTQAPSSVYDSRLFSYLVGGGSVGEDISFMFSWSPFPQSMLHHAHIGYHGILEGIVGEGSLNARAGALFPFDFQRPAHRFPVPGGEAAGALTVGGNLFRLDDANPGVELYGRPAWGPFSYQVALLAGDTAGAALDRDDWKDLFARLTYTLFQNSSHEVTPGLFGYLGRAELPMTVGGVELLLADDFWIAGADLEADVGPFNLFAMAYARRDSDAYAERGATELTAVRTELLWGPLPSLTTSVRYEQVFSRSRKELEAAAIVTQVTYGVAANALATLAYRHDAEEARRSSALLLLDVAF